MNDSSRPESARTGKVVNVVGGGLAGCEAAWQLAAAGIPVRLHECRPDRRSPAHATGLLAELVCSNSFKSDDPATAHGLLKAEMRRAGSLVLACADETRVAAGQALAVDRERFAAAITERIAAQPLITVERHEVVELPEGPAIVATGPLTAGALYAALADACGGEALHFYDAIAPIVDAASIDMSIAFRASRWGKDAAPGDAAAGEGQPAEAGDYINCPLDRNEYEALVQALRTAEQVRPHAFEEARYFEGCLPVEVLAERGPQALAFGPMRPVGLRDPRTGRWPHAVVQLRPENRFRTAFNLVGFQTRLTYPEQKRVFRSIPGLGGAEFLRLGSIHRNSYVDSPRALDGTLQLRARPGLRLAGQLCGVEGYMESTAMGLVAARLLAVELRGGAAVPPPAETACGALLHHVTRARASNERFEPSGINFGLLPPAPAGARRNESRRAICARALQSFEGWLAPA